jgi:hypothetical protein
MLYLKISLLLLGSGLLLFLPPVTDSLAPASSPTDTAQVQQVRAFPLPAQVSFAGEPVPLTDPDIRERLEREIIQNCYKHAATLMILKREGRWRQPLEEILDRNGIPRDFFYLCVAESELDELAVSGVGAMGFWQFMKGTAGEFGLEVSAQVDMRKDPLASTEAACRYLKQAQAKFGNWTLTAASYNRGMNGLDKAIKNQKVNSFYNLYLNRETYRYVLRIVSLKIILENPAAYGFVVPAQERYQPYATRTVQVDTTINNLPDFAAQFGLSYKTLKIHNPWLDSDDYRLVIPKGRNYALRLPAEAKLAE